ncbi:MAG: lytic transglycosylase domain-containing protein [Gammaproteobacteria bacterium]
MKPLTILRAMRTPGLSIAWLLVAHAASADYYIYKENDGTRWYTNLQMPGDSYTLIATVGRPTAASSCAGVTHAIMQQRALTHSPVIEQYAQIYGVDARMIKAIISVESCFDRHAVSRVGAKGLMQLMPATAQELGVYDAFNANDNMRGGIRYFSEMLSRFDKNTEFALAAYNAGPRAVEKYNGIPPYEATQQYVKRVLEYYERYAALDQ